MPSQDPGQLRHELILQEVTGRVKDGAGGYTERWRNARDGLVFGAVERLSGNERLRAMQTHSDATHLVTIRYRTGVSAKNRWIHQGRVLKIVEPPHDADDRHARLAMLCREET